MGQFLSRRPWLIDWSRLARVGMVVQSFAHSAGPEDFNLVLWTWGPERPSRFVLIDDEGRLTGGRRA